MTEVPQAVSSIEVTLVELERVKRALLHIAEALKYYEELLEGSNKKIDRDLQEKHSKLGKAFTELATLSFSLSKEVTDTLGEKAPGQPKKIEAHSLPDPEVPKDEPEGISQPVEDEPADIIPAEPSDPQLDTKEILAEVEPAGIPKGELPKGNTHFDPNWFVDAELFPVDADALIWNNDLSSDEEKELTDLQKRKKKISTVAKAYKAHPAVQTAILNQREHERSGYRTKKDDELGVYLGEMGSYNLLTSDEVKELTGYIDEGLLVYETMDSFENISSQQAEAFVRLAAAHQVMFLANLRLVFSTIKPRFGSLPFSVMDALGAGNEGLANAICSFDASRELEFSTLASKCISNELSKTIQRESRLIRLPKQAHTQYVEAQRSIRERSEKLGRDLSDDEIKEATGMSIKDYYALKKKATYYLPSLNQKIGDKDSDDGVEFGELIPDSQGNMDAIIDAFSDREQIKYLVRSAGLDNREMFVLGLRFDLNPELLGPLVVESKNGKITYEDAVLTFGQDNATRDAIGAMLGVSGERVRQIELITLDRLKRAANGQTLPFRKVLNNRLKHRGAYPTEDKPQSTTDETPSAANSIEESATVSEELSKKASGENHDTSPDVPVISPSVLAKIKPKIPLPLSSMNLQDRPKEQTVLPMFALPSTYQSYQRPSPKKPVVTPPTPPSVSDLDAKLKGAKIKTPNRRIRGGGRRPNMKGKGQGPKSTWEQQVEQMEREKAEKDS